MIFVYADKEIRLAQGFNEIVIDTDRDVELSLENNFVDTIVFIRLKRVGNLHLRSFHFANSSCRILVWNTLNAKLLSDEHHEIMANADLKICYAEISRHEVERNTWIALREKGAHGLVSCSGLVADKFNVISDVVNFAPETVGEICNFMVVLKGGKLYIDAIGKIIKGAYHSQSHQQSRAMCFASGQTSTIIPKLIIDENDVQASHAMTIGRMNEEAMFYLNSRGLSQKQATALIARGYLQPITNFLGATGLEKELQNELERELVNL